MSFMIDDKVWGKYDEIWKVIKDKLGTKFHSEPVYDYKYLRVKVRKFDGINKNQLFRSWCTKRKYACITIDFVMRMDKKYFPQVYLEECKYKIKRIQMPRFINVELKSDSSDSDSEAEPEYNTAN